MPGNLCRLLAADAWSPAPAQNLEDLAASGDDGTATPSKASDSDDASEMPSAAASPSPSPSPSDVMSDTGDETSTPKASPSPSPESGAPPVDVEPPLPGEPNADTAADSVPLPANPALEQQFSEWDLAQVESPLFLSAAIDEFNDRPILLTGNWSVKPHLSLGTYYDGNIFLRSHDVKSDFIARVAPGVTMRLGDTDSMFYLVADYTLGFDLYVQHPSESTIDQDGRAQLQWSLPKTIIGLTLDVSTDTGQDVDVSDRVKQDLYFAGLTTHYDFGEKTSWDFSAAYTRSDYDGLISSSQVEGDVFFNYQYSPKTQLGIGGGIGELFVPGSPSQTFEDFDLRATYRATGKLTLISEIGSEFRQYGSGEGDSLTPVFLLQAAWVPKFGTQLSLTGRRSVYASALLEDQNYTASSLDFLITQRITDVVNVSLAAGFVNADYSATSTSVDATREDNYYYIRPGVEWKALDWLSVGIFYQYSQDLSSGGDTGNFTRDEGGVDVAILF